MLTIITVIFKVGLTTSQGSYLVSLIGISNTIARVILGAMSQKMNRLFLYNTCLLICGMTMAVSNFIQPMMAAAAGVDCDPFLNNSSVTDSAGILINSTDAVDIINTTVSSMPWVCDHYIGQVSQIINIYILYYFISSSSSM